MKKKIALAAIICALVLSLTACGTSGNAAQTTVQTEATAEEEITAAESGSDAALDMSAIAEAGSADDIDFGTTTTIEMGEVTAISGDGAWYDEGIVTITQGGEFVLSGTLKGYIYIDTTENVKLLMNGVEITNENGAAIYCYSAKNLFVELAGGTVNTVSDGSSYTFGGTNESAADEEPNSCIYSKADLTLYGTGSLNVNASYKNGITSKDDLTIEGGNITVTALNTGISGKDSLTVSGGTITVNSTGDALKSTNDTDEGKGYMLISGGTLTLSTAEDAVQAQTDLTITGGTINITTTGAVAEGGNDMGWGGGWNGQQVQTDTTATEDDATSKGIKCGGNMAVSEGAITISSTDHCIHSTGTMTISGGTLTLASSSGKGISSHGDLLISNGKIDITEATEGIESKALLQLDGGTINITASDDGLNAGGGSDSFGVNSTATEASVHNLIINGGTLYVNAAGDGLDSNGNLTVNGGAIIVEGPINSGNGALDCGDSNCTITVNGGTLLALGSIGMAENPSASSTQNSICVGFDSVLAEGTAISVKASDGSTVYEYTTTKQVQHMVLSSADLVTGSTYTVTAGSSTAATVTISSAVTAVGTQSTMGGGNFGGGGMGGEDFGGGMGGNKPGAMPNANA